MKIEHGHDLPPAAPQKRAYRGGLRLEQKQQTQARVLDAALRFFGEVGYEAASLRQIAEHAGVSHGVVRLHYGSKEELWKHAVRYLFERQRNEILAHYNPERALNNPREALEQILRAYVEYSSRHPEHIRIMVRESISGGERLDWIAQNFVQRLHQQLEVLLKAAVREGILPDQPLVSLLYLMVGAAQSMAMVAAEVKAIHGIDAVHPSVVAKHADAVVATLLRPAPAGQRESKVDEAAVLALAVMPASEDLACDSGTPIVPK